MKTPENAKSMLPFLIFHWVDLNGGIMETHLGEPIKDVNEYFRQREDWIDKNIKGH